MSRTDITVAEPSHVSRARLLAAAAAERCGLADQQVHRVSIAATELATNLLKHATTGLFSVNVVPGRLDLLSVDKGPGIARISDSMRDGFSTTGTLGHGFGAVRRAADVFDVYTQLGAGTAVLARWNADPPNWDGLRLGGTLATAPGETSCGDRWIAVRAETGADTVTVAVSDGLGHGEPAAKASLVAIAAIAAHADRGPSMILRTIQPVLAPTRGATIAVVQFAPGREQLRFSGIGNVSTRLYSASGARPSALLSRPGIAGAAVPAGLTESTHPWSPDSWLLMHTDGVSERWSTGDWPGLLGHDPSTVAAWVLGQRGRGRDDACVVAVTGGNES
ncbi:MAG TPA: SpoIIE family protein phosphatase [Pseudonocardiaceae bacterium]|nr:SpoIIE family protein phosphatase [Pseudonocardiaceae bacterium]